MTKGQSSYRNYLLVSIMMLLMAASISIHQFKVPTIMGDVAKALNMSTGAATWMMSIFTFMGILLAIPAGGIVQKFGGKIIVIFSCGVVAVGSLIGAASGNGGVMLLSRAVEGLGFVLVAVAGPIVIARYCDPAKLGVSMGIWAAWVATGQIISFNLTPVLFGAIGWRPIWIIYAAFTVVMAVIVSLILKKPTDPADASENKASAEKAHLSEVLTNKNLICAGFAFTIFNFLLFVVLTFLPTYAVKAGLMGTQEASFAATIPMIGCLIGSPAFGKISEKTGRKILYILALAASGIGAAMSFSPFKPVIYIGVILFGLVGLSAPGIMLGSVSNIVGNPKLDGIGMGVTITLQNLGMFLGTAIFLPILTACGGNYTIAGIVMLPIALIGIILAAVSKMK